LSEAFENLKVNTDRLSKAKVLHGLKSESGGMRKSGLKSSFNHSQSVLLGSGSEAKPILEEKSKTLGGKANLRKLSGLLC